MRDLSELDLAPCTIACLESAGITTVWELEDYTCRELIWHSQITPETLYDALRGLRQHGKTLKPTTNAGARRLRERDLKIFRLRVVEGRTLRATGEQVGLGPERIRQLLALRFGLQGDPPIIKARPRRNRRRTVPDCIQLGRAIQRLRSAKSLTVDDLAAAIDVSAEELARIEDGLRNPTWTTLAQLALGLDTTAALLAYAIEVEPHV